MNQWLENAQAAESEPQYTIPLHADRKNSVARTTGSACQGWMQLIDLGCGL